MAGTSSALPVLYFLFIVVVGGFFIVNLFLAVIFEEFLLHKVRSQPPKFEAQLAQPPNVQLNLNFNFKPLPNS